MPEVTATITAGCGLKWDEPIVSPQIKRRVRAAFRPWVALALARIAGALDDADRISLTLPPPLADLTPLAGLTRLRALVLATGMSTDRVPVDLAPLTGLNGCYHLTDLIPLAALDRLAKLDVSYSPKLAHLPQQRLMDRASVAALLASLRAD